MTSMNVPIYELQFSGSDSSLLLQTSNANHSIATWIDKAVETMRDCVKRNGTEEKSVLLY